jgi:hypothetical protein
MIYDMITWIISTIKKIVNRNQQVINVQAKPKFSAKGMVEGRQYQFFYRQSTHERLSEIDRTIMFFSATLVKLQQRPECMISNKEEYVLTTLRKGVDTQTGMPYTHEYDILESEIQKVVLLD